MVMMEVEKAGHKYVFHIPQGAPYRDAFEAVHEIQSQLLEWQKIQEQRSATPPSIETEQTSA